MLKQSACSENLVCFCVFHISWATSSTNWHKQLKIVFQCENGCSQRGTERYCINIDTKCLRIQFRRTIEWINQFLCFKSVKDSVGSCMMHQMLMMSEMIQMINVGWWCSSCCHCRCRVIPVIAWMMMVMRMVLMIEQRIRMIEVMCGSQRWRSQIRIDTVR